MSPYRTAAVVPDEAFLRRRRTDWPVVTVASDHATLAEGGRTAPLYWMMMAIAVTVPVIIGWL